MSQSSQQQSSPAESEVPEIAPVEAPVDFLGILKQLGPGLIIAGSIVGSGELIATTKTGAQAGIVLLWLIIIGCLIKVFVQIELGRYAISHGETTLSALDRIPGLRLRVNWIVWMWGLMMLFTIGQLGGIVGGVGQALALTIPIRGDYVDAIRVPSVKEFDLFLDWDEDASKGNEVPAAHRRLAGQLKDLGDDGQQLLEERRNLLAMPDGDERKNAEATFAEKLNPWTYDDKIWASVIAVLTAVVLYAGRYGLIQNISLILVVSFTFITIGNVISLQTSEEFHLSADEILSGLMFRTPETIGGVNPWIIALATFGIIGVGASELIAYPYWCLEKGYARFAGRRSDDEAWVRRARGWMKVMHYDAFASMLVYTLATVAFYMMGVAVLHREGSDPDGMRMVSTLATAYVPVFGEYAKWLFLLGAIAVLYSTFLVANAANARMATDGLKVFGLLSKNNERAHQRSLSVFSVLLPLTCLLIYCTGANPVTLITWAGIMQAAMLPVLGFSSIYLRFRLTDDRLRPSRLWDLSLLVSCIGLLLAGGYGVLSKLKDFF